MARALCPPAAVPLSDILIFEGSILTYEHPILKHEDAMLADVYLVQLHHGRSHLGATVEVQANGGRSGKNLSGSYKRYCKATVPARNGVIARLPHF